MKNILALTLVTIAIAAPFLDGAIGAQWTLLAIGFGVALGCLDHDQIISGAMTGEYSTSSLSPCTGGKSVCRLCSSSF